MCVGHPKTHPCKHTSITYNFCVAAHLDRTTGMTSPCPNTSYAAMIDTQWKCTNRLCHFEEHGRAWTCCLCGNGPNLVGWCTFDRPRTERNAITQQLEHVTTCYHCCCKRCIPDCESNRHPSNSCLAAGQKNSGHGGSSKGGGSSNQQYKWYEETYDSKGHTRRKQK
ncbi:hypothetical protein diail_2097 [Diaporthe ilicicola]|nr:hypothetical protein diail_2097 [Diaporthe ilicicola]